MPGRWLALGFATLLLQSAPSFGADFLPPPGAGEPLAGQPVVGTPAAKTQPPAQNAAARGKAADAPKRVVSVNLCTDQLAMMLAAPGQLLSVSHLAQDPRASVMAEAARGYRVNRGSAEDVYLMHPDLVLAGTFTTRFTVDLLRRLGVEVLELPPATGLDDVPRQLRAVGAAMGREAEAEALIDAFTADLARLSEPPPRRLSAAAYGPNGYTSGPGTLSDELFRAAGLRNVATELGLAGGGMLAMERLVMASPDLLVTSAPNPGASRAEELLSHPALVPLRAKAGSALMSDADWVCGLPQVLAALEDLVAARDAVLSRPGERSGE